MSKKTEIVAFVVNFFQNENGVQLEYRAPDDTGLAMGGDEKGRVWHEFVDTATRDVACRINSVAMDELSRGRSNPEELLLPCLRRLSAEKGAEGSPEGCISVTIGELRKR